MEINDEILEESMIELLKVSDLSVTTKKSLIQQLEIQLKVNLDSKKEFLTQILNNFVEKKSQEINNVEWSDSDGDEGDNVQDDDDDDEVSYGKKAKSRSNNGFNKELQLSTDLSDFLGETTSTRGQVVKAMWEYIKEKNLQNPKDRREILCDKKLEKLFKRKKVTMFNMNKFLAPMMKDIEALTEEKPKARKLTVSKVKLTPKLDEKIRQSDEYADALYAEKHGKKKLIARKRELEKVTKPLEKLKRKKIEKEENKQPRNSGFTKLMALSNELAAFIGSPQESRTQVTSKLWAHIREQNLQNPSDKREILLDDKLKAVFKVNKVTMFTINKYLVKHIFPIESSSSAVDDVEDEDDN